MYLIPQIATSKAYMHTNIAQKGERTNNNELEPAMMYSDEKAN